MTTGCIKCPGKKSIVPAKKSTAPRAGSVAPRVLPPSEPPAGRQSRPGLFEAARVGGRGTQPPLPFDPAQAVPGVNDPRLKIVAAPPVKYRRRGLGVAFMAIVLGGVGGWVWWRFFRGSAPAQWAKRVKPLKWDAANLGVRTGSYYPCSRSQLEPRPLLVLFDSGQRSAEVIAAWAHHAERHGWIIASP